ncbi:ROK family protein [Corynebacterium aquatimens]|nr:ROK family protein [Corynebacterium aquatimens]
MQAATLALDIGGTKIAYGLVPDSDPQTVVGEGRLPAHAHSGRIGAQVTQAVTNAIKEAANCGLVISRVGAGAPGIVRPEDGVVVHAGPTIPGWAGTDLGALMRAAFTTPESGPGAPDIPVAVHNDVRVWAWGEDHFGAAKDIDGRVLYLSLGTGLGALWWTEGS